MTHSVIIPLFNKADYIVSTLESLLMQSKQPDELIIVDDASSDGSLGVAADFLQKNAALFKNCRIEIIQLTKNMGPGNARNMGLAKASCELISFLDADDLYHPHLLQRVSEVFEGEGLDFLVLSMEFLPGGEVYPDLKALERFLSLKSENLYLIKTPLRAVTSPHFIMGVGSNVVTRRRWIATQYATSSFLNEGIDFWYRVLKHILTQNTGRIALLTGNYLKVREVAGSLSRRTYSHFKEIEIPPVILRYENSKDINDRLLTGMVGERWYVYSLQSLLSAKQKLLFILHYSYLLPKYVNYLFIRRFSKS